MPLYIFQHTDTGETRDVFHRMNDPKVYNGENGRERGKWKRVFTVPQAMVDCTPLDPYSAKDFARVTNKKGTMGDLWDKSAEMSARRAEKEGGVDPVQERFYDKYAAGRNNHQHPERLKKIARRNVEKKMETMGLKAQWD